jgi:hypothetical protein
VCGAVNHVNRVLRVSLLPKRFNLVTGGLLKEEVEHLTQYADRRLNGKFQWLCADRIKLIRKPEGIPSRAKACKFIGLLRRGKAAPFQGSIFCKRFWGTEKSPHLTSKGIPAIESRRLKAPGDF